MNNTTNQIDKDTYINETRFRIIKRFNYTKHSNGFSNKEAFTDWYIEQLQLQNFNCCYCDTSIFNIQSLIKQGKLKTRKVRGEGFRGSHLEIDKKVNDKGYTIKNCVLACYYCNNDKSYIMDSDIYKLFFGDARRKYFEYLTNL